MYILKNEDNLSSYPVSKDKLLSMLDESFAHISGKIGPFRNEDVIVTLKSSGGGGGANPGSCSIFPLIIPDHTPIESLYTLILHEMTHVLTYQWGESFIPLFSEGIAYLICGIYIEEKYGNTFHAFVNAYLETREITLLELLDPQKFFISKESYSYISKVSASFTRYLIEKYGIESLKSTFTLGKETNNEKTRYQRARKHRENCLVRWLFEIDKRDLDELETEYLVFIKQHATYEPNPSFYDRKEKDLIQREYPRWHCYKCWRPNNETTNRCDHCNTRKQEKNEFSKR